MRKSFLLFVLAIGCSATLLFAASCSSDTSDPLDTSSADLTVESPSPAETDEDITSAEVETESPYLIPDPTRIDLTTFTTGMFKDTFRRGSGAYPEQSAEGIRFVGRNESRDPWVFWVIPK